MRANALYFPFISIPQSDWVIKTMLYWDKFASIVPFDHTQRPEQLTPFMRNLLREGLVEQVLPSDHLWKVHNFEEIFIGYIKDKLIQAQRFSSLPKLKRTNRKPRRFSIHMEKLQGLANWLEEKGLAERVNYSWYDVDDWVAGPFMAYLASVLGILEEVNATPITDDLYLAHYYKIYKTQYNPKVHAETRDFILDQLLPVPLQNVSLDDLLNFKSKYGHLLPSLRTKIETYSTEIATIPDYEARIARRETVTMELKEELEHVKEAMSRSLGEIAFEIVIPLVGAGGALYVTDPGQNAIAAGAAGLSFIASCYKAIAAVNTERVVLNKPLAYLAFIDKKLISP